MKHKIKKSWPYLLLIIIIGLASSILDGYISIYMMKIVDTTLGGNRELFFTQARILLLLAVALLPINILLSYSKGLFKYKTLTSSKVSFMAKIFNKNISEFQKDNNGLYVSAITNDMNTIENNYIEGIFQLAISFIGFIVSIVVIYSVSPVALFIGVGITISSTILVMIISKPLQNQQSQRSKLFEGYITYLKEVLGAFSIIKANNLGLKVKTDYYNKSKDIQQKGFIIDKIYTYFLSVQSFTTNLSFFGIAAIVVYMAIKGSITTGGVILIVNNMDRIIYPVMQASEWLPKIFSVKPIFNNIDKILENQDQYEETIDLSRFKKEIKFENVSFGYDDQIVLKEINLILEKGKKYLIIGPSGGGKSTLLKLLRKYFSPNKGLITIDDIDFKDITKNSYFKNIANVEQQVFLFEDTLKNNLTLYKDYSDDEINLAIRRAGLLGFVENLQDGLDSMLYDNGKNVSGGEKSRIAIARGLLAKTDIILLDEAFASLDSKVAREIEKTLLSLEGITVINVSHVIFEETRKDYSQVITVANGRIH